MTGVDAMIGGIEHSKELARWYIVELGDHSPHDLALIAGHPQKDSLRLSVDGTRAIVQPMQVEPTDIDAFISHLNAHADTTIAFDTTDAARMYIDNPVNGFVGGGA